MTVIEMSITGAVMIAAIALIRAFTVDKLPKKAFVILWELALLRLLVPFDISSALSIYNLFDFRKNEEPIQAADYSYTEEIPVSYTEAETAERYIPDVYYTADHEPSAVSAPVYNANISEDIPEDEEKGISVWKIIHIAGTVIVTVGFLTAYIVCYGRFRFSRTAKNDFIRDWVKEQRIKRRIKVCVSDKISSPLTYGILNPVILLPENIDMSDTENLKYILTHELIHIKRFDMLRKIIAAAAVCLHWFDPAVWALYVLYNRDIELVCDEAVVRNAEGDCRSAYARALIGMEEKRGGVLYSSFSRNSIEERITAIMKTKKLTAVSVIAAFAIAAGVTAVFATSAANNENITDEISADTETENVDDKISALYNDDYKSMSISQFRKKALEIMSESEYEKYFADNADSYSADSEIGKFIYGALKPLTSAAWDKTSFDDILSSDTVRYAGGDYKCIVTVKDSEKAAVGDYMGVHAALNSFFSENLEKMCNEKTEDRSRIVTFLSDKVYNKNEYFDFINSYSEKGLELSIDGNYYFPAKEVPDDTELFPVNSKGMTYGSHSESGEYNVYPELIAAVSVDGVLGYMKRTDFISFGDYLLYEHYTEPVTDEVQLENLRNAYKQERSDYEILEFNCEYCNIPLYDTECEEVVGYFRTNIHTYIDTERCGSLMLSDEEVYREKLERAAEIYKTVFLMKTDDYKDMSVLNFNGRLMKWENDNYNVHNAVGSCISNGLFPEELTEEELDFLKYTFIFSEDEARRRSLHYMRGDPEEDPGNIIIGAEKLIDVDKHIAMWCRFTYHISDIKSVTVGERDSALKSFIEKVNTLWDDTPAEDMAVIFDGTDPTAELKKDIIKAAEEYSNEHIAISVTEEGIGLRTNDGSEIME